MIFSCPRRAYNPQLVAVASVASTADAHRRAFAAPLVHVAHSIRRSMPYGWLLAALCAVLALQGAAAAPATSTYRTVHRSLCGAQHKQGLATCVALSAAQATPADSFIRLHQGLSSARRLLQQNAPLEPLAGAAEVRSSLPHFAHRLVGLSRAPCAVEQRASR